MKQIPVSALHLREATVFEGEEWSSLLSADGFRISLRLDRLMVVCRSPRGGTLLVPMARVRSIEVPWGLDAPGLPSLLNAMRTPAENSQMASGDE
ncbi:MAG: hypothetical protein IPK60_04260 [Sandaracinaceae bacterium]|nr:hypothetical protein [Sandaracinaceae bacterium]